MGRKQFTFYRSYYEAVQALNKRDQTAVLLAVCDYALNETEPNLTGAAKAIFALIRPTLDAARRKAEGGMAKGKGEDSAKIPQRYDEDNSKMPQRYDEDSANKKEGEKENEKKKKKENEIEGEEEKEKEDPADLCGRCFTLFWDAYPTKIRREDAWEEWKRLASTEAQASTIMGNLEAWKKTSQWLEDGGRFVPAAAKFLADPGYWNTAPISAKNGKKQDRELDAEELAAIKRMMAKKENHGRRELGEIEIAAIKRMMAEG